jgi:hypothetical protein
MTIKLEFEKLGQKIEEETEGADWDVENNLWELRLKRWSEKANIVEEWEFIIK